MKTKIIWILLGVTSMFSIYTNKAMLNANNSSDITFLINEKPIQDTYDKEAVVKIFIPKEVDVNNVELRVYELNEPFQIIENPTWEKQEDGFIYAQTVKDIEQTHYEVWDKDNHMVMASSATFTIDTIAPVLEMKVNGKKVKEFPRHIKEDTHFEIGWSDLHLDSNRIIYKLKKDDVVVQNQEKENIIKFDIKDEGNYVFEAEASDTFQHTASFSTIDEPLTLDRTKPIVTFFQGDKVLDKKEVFYKQEVITIFAEDKNFNPSNSYLFLNQKKVETVWIWNGQDWTTNVSLSRHGTYKLGYHVEDTCGNQMENVQATTILIDLKEPKVEVKMDQESIKESFSKFYAKEKQLTINIKEDTLDEERSWVQLNNEKLPIIKKQKGVYQIRSYLKDGTYDLMWNLVDKGEHKEEKQFDSFHIDTKAPKIIVKSNHTKAFENNMITYQFQIKEQNLDDEAIKFWYEYKEQKITPQINWIKAEDGWSGTITYHDDGAYKLFFDVADKAGNKALLHTTQGQTLKDSDMQFVIDTISPKLDVVLQTSQYYTKGQIIKWSVQDQHMEQRDVILTLSKNGVLQNPNKIQKGKWTSIEIQEDGKYQISFQGKDKAGNSITYTSPHFMNKKPYIFVVDTLKPNVKLDVIGKQMGKHDVRIQYQIHDRNLQSYQIHILRNGQPLQKASQRGTRNKNSVILFHENTNAFGRYQVSISAVDKAGNKTTNIHPSFVIDKKPVQLHTTMNQLPIKDKRSYITNQAVTIQMKWKDEYLKTANIVVKKNGVIEQRKDKGTAISLSFVPQAGYENKYDIDAILYDQAGNKTTQSFHFVIDKKIEIPKIGNDVFQGKPYAKDWIPQLKKQNEKIVVLDTLLLRNQKPIPYQWGVPIKEDGVYALHLLVQDGANNHARLVKPFYFEIDKTPPILQLQYKNGDKIQYSQFKNEPISLVVKGSDSDNQDTITKIKVNGVIQNLEKQKVQQYELDTTKYTTLIIEAEAKDIAGNVTYKKWNLQKEKDIKKVESDRDIYSYIPYVLIVIVLIGGGSVWYVRRKAKV